MHIVCNIPNFKTFLQMDVDERVVGNEIDSETDAGLERALHCWCTLLVSDNACKNASNLL